MSDLVNFTAKELERIIRVCGRSRVKRFKLSELEIEFDEFKQVEADSYQEISSPEEVSEKPAQPMTAFDKQEIYNQLLIEDPLALEEMTMRGDNQE